MRRKIAGLLTLIMVFSFLPLQAQASLNESISVSLEVRGDLDMGTIYDNTINLEETKTVFNLLQDELDRNNISMEYEKEWSYVTKINGLGQLEKGPNSGWMYKVNNKSEDVGAGDRVLKDGDKVLFYYTLDYTVDDSESDRNEGDIKDLAYSSKWALPSMEKAIELGIISGDDQGYINAQSDITRAEFVKILLKVIDEEPEDLFTGIFSDVSKDDWYASSVEKAAKLGLVSGVENKKFLPDEYLSRQDMAVIIARTYDLQGKEPSHLSDFTGISKYAQQAVGAMLQNTIMRGIGNDYFAPRLNVTREMAVVTMIRLLDRQYIKDVTLNSFNR